ncbi:MAG: tetratricopeptide repeat protein [Betaproteobacteria bacterium]
MNESFEQARALFIGGIEDFEAGRYPDAEQKFTASLALVPGRVSTLANLAATRIKLGQPEAALALLDQALSTEPEHHDALAHRGLALADLGRHAEALVALERLLQIDPQRTLAWYFQGVSLQALQRYDEALAAFERFLQELEQPQHADAWFRSGQTLQLLDRNDGALTAFDHALRLEPGMTLAWTHRGSIYKDQNRLDEAKVAFEHALAHGGDPQLNGYFLAAVTGERAPATAPREYVQGLFDDYAAGFESHLVGVLKYQGHTVLIENLRALGPRQFIRALDLGCGTGLCGPLLRPVVQHLDGVDLSPNMLEQARSLGVYDALIGADIVDYLSATDHRYDLLVAADVFIYVGDLEPVFAGARGVLQAGGILAFSAEIPEGLADMELKPTLRYGQSERYVRDLARRHDFEIVTFVQRSIREDKRRPVAGYYAYLRRR